MSNAAIDENGRPAIICASKDDGVAIVSIMANPSNHGLKIDDNSSGSDNGNNNGAAMADQNGKAVWTALSSDGNGSVIEVYGDPATGKVLINSN